MTFPLWNHAVIVRKLFLVQLQDFSMLCTYAPSVNCGIPWAVWFEIAQIIYIILYGNKIHFPTVWNE